MFYLDTDDGTTREREGFDMPDCRAAADHALAMLPIMALQEPTEMERREYRVTLRDGEGQPVFEAVMLFVVSWMR